VSAAATPVTINWGVSSFYGWGVYGLNLALHWADDPELAAACPRPILERELALDPLRRARLARFARRSIDLHRWIADHAPGEARLSGVLLDSLDQRFAQTNVRADLAMAGERTVGVTFFQDPKLTREAVERARAYPVMVTGSSWNAEVLRAYDVPGVRVILQGIDPTLFHPAPRTGLYPDRFLVFSGGKLERRKGQDIVMAAFARFAQRHADALLVTAWDSPWPGAARDLDASGLAAPTVWNAGGERVDVRGWAQANGVAPGQVVDLGAVPNALLPPVQREMDVALFPNRAEGGTNLVAMEAMACGVPAILSRNTGHLDLIAAGNCLTLDTQRPLAGSEAGWGDVAGWGESDVEEAVAALERAYQDRDAARAVGARGAATLARLTWAETARRMKGLIRELA
jgi:glycosyltransferase involved in cell wall biosynthesis